MPKSARDIALDHGTRVWVLTVPWKERAQAAAAGASYHTDIKAWAYIGQRLPEQLADYDSPRYSLERWIEDSLNETARTEPIQPRSQAPRATQLEAVRAAVRAFQAGFTGFAQLDGTGRGKTLSIVELIRRLSITTCETVLVVCPTGAIPGWRRTIADAEADLPDSRRKRWLVINYQATKRLLDATGLDLGVRRRTKNRRLVQQGTLRYSFDAVVADESQALIHFVSQQSQVVWRYSEAARYVVWASATPGYNPLHFAYMSRSFERALSKEILPRVPLEQKSAAAFQDAWGAFLAEQGFAVRRPEAKTPPKRSGRPPATWRWEPADTQTRRRDVARIQSWLFGATPMAISRPAPPTPREPLSVALDAGGRRLYRAAWLEYRRAVGLPVWRTVGARRVLMKNPTGLAATLRLRQKCSHLRVPGTVAQTVEWVLAGRQVFVSALFHESVDALVEGLEKARIATVVADGRVTQAGRADAVRQFQLGMAPVIVSTTTSAISLHANERLLPDGRMATGAVRETLVHDPRYSPIDVAQIEGRCNRTNAAGADESSTCWYAFGEGTVEEPMVLSALRRLEDVGVITANDDLVDVDSFLAGLIDDQ